LRTASIDIGTNTIRLLISEQSGRGILKKLCINRVITRLGEGFSDNTRLLNSNAVNRSVAALYDFSKVIKKFNVNKIRAVATSVVRESKNGEKFVKQVADKTGLAVEVISGEEEAKLSVLGVLNSVSVNANNCIIFDIGGGSTEYVHIRSSNIVNLVSTNLGVVHLNEEFLRSEIETEQELANLSIYIKETLQRELENFEVIDKKDLILIGTAGTPTTLAAIELKLKEYNPELVNNFVLSEEMILSTIKKLLNIHKKDRAKITGLEKGREDILVAGALILIETLRKYSQNSVIVSNGGVLEGIAYSQN
jgi:exopolyphosphatase/guanosine-5'-triphosphate,3'-diphosphate pyrophosphatase